MTGFSIPVSWSSLSPRLEDEASVQGNRTTVLAGSLPFPIACPQLFEDLFLPDAASSESRMRAIHPWAQVLADRPVLRPLPYLGSRRRYRFRLHQRRLSAAVPRGRRFNSGTGLSDQEAHLVLKKPPAGIVATHPGMDGLNQLNRPTALSSGVAIPTTLVVHMERGVPLARLERTLAPPVVRLRLLLILGAIESGEKLAPVNILTYFPESIGIEEWGVVHWKNKKGKTKDSTGSVQRIRHVLHL